MEKIVADLPEMIATAKSITGMIEQFRDEKSKTQEASQALSTGWEGVAAQKYLDRMNEYLSWMETMAGVLEDYPAVLEETVKKYIDVDFFKP